MPKRDFKPTPAPSQHEAARKLEILRNQIKAGVEALDRGDFVEVDERDLGAFIRSPYTHRRPAGRRRS
jgi:hypothetical protein